MPLGEASGLIPYTVYMARDSFMQEQPEVIAAFTKAIYRGQIWVSEHSSAEIADAILPQFPDSDLDTLTTIIERYKAQDTWKTNPSVSEDGFLLLQEIMIEGGELTEQIPYAKLVNTSFVDAVMKK